MELTTAQQTTAFLWAFALGAFIEIMYFIISVIREMFPPGKLGLFFIDMIFMISVFIINFLYSASLTEGKIRSYVVAAEIISFVLLYFFIGRTIKCIVGSFCIRIKNKIYTFFAKFTKYSHK